MPLPPLEDESIVIDHLPLCTSSRENVMRNWMRIGRHKMDTHPITRNKRSDS
jgi:hypothetical protein